MKISTEGFEILTDIVEILITPADFGVQPADLFFSGVETQTLPNIYYGRIRCVEEVFLSFFTIQLHSS